MDHMYFQMDFLVNTSINTTDKDETTDFSSTFGWNWTTENDTSLFSTDDYILDHPVVRVSLCLAYTIVFIFCFFGNLTVIVVACLHWRMRNVTKFCMGNLAFANFCVALFCIYQNLSTFLYETWIFGRFLCKMYYFINSLSHTASILILVVICIERYISIIHPWKCRQIITIQRLRLTIAGVWVLSGLISAPRLHYMTTLKIPVTLYSDGEAEEDVICAPTPTLYNSPTAEIVFFVLLFVCPLIVMSILYTRIASIIWQSSTLLQAGEPLESSTIPALPLRVIRQAPRVPHNSRETRSYTSTTTTTSSHRNHKQHLSKVSASATSFESAISRAEQDPNSCVNDRNGGVNGDSVINMLRRTLEASAVRANHITVLRIKDERRGRVLQSRQAAVRMLIVIVISFAVCNFPYYLRRIFQYYVTSYNIGSSFNQFMTPVTFLLMYTNCALNPILYAFMSKSFRSSLKDLLKLRLSKGRNDARRQRHVLPLATARRNSF